MAYRFALDLSLLCVHPIFHIMLLKRYHKDSDYITHLSLILLDESLSYEEKTISIVVRDV